MPVELKILASARVSASDEFRTITAVAVRLLDHLNTASAQREITKANRPGSSSSLVQSVFREFALSLGFADESRGLFSEYENRGLRPDYFMQVGDTGILLEVERGKTTINNMDLLDFWKCHLCAHANYLFLVVPKELRQNPTMAPRREFAAVAKRLATFFLPRNETNVRALFLFGY